MMSALTIARRELGSYFATPVAYVFITIFLILSGVFTFLVGNLFERNQADLAPFFLFHPWLYLFFVPAIAMRSWSEERKSGSIELLMTLPIHPFSAVMGKFLAAWAMMGICLFLTTPIWLTIEFLGAPDRGVITLSYVSSWLMSASFISIAMCMSALTKNQVVAFILAIVICFLFVVSGTDMVLDVFTQWASSHVVDSVASFSFLYRFESITKGIVSISDLLYFFTTTAVWLYASLVVIEHKKAD